MKIGKFWVMASLGMPAVVAAQPTTVGIDLRVDVGDNYDSIAPGDPVGSVDVFYDQLSPYGVWVDEPDVGRVFIPEETGFVPYTIGHWQYTSLGFVWISNDRFGWATSHYGRWAFSNNYNRWVWWPDIQWGPAWVEWRQTSTDFGWSPLPPDAFVRVGYQPPVESWRYCNADHVLDVNVTRYYEPRERVVVIQREAKPMAHYSMVSNVRVTVGPNAAVLREHHVTSRPVKVEARAIGRWTPTEARTQVAVAQQRKVSFEAQNQRRVETSPAIREAQAKVVDTHPTIRAQVNARAQPPRVEPNARPAQRTEPQRVEPKVQPQRVEPKAQPQPPRAEPKAPQPQRVESKAQPQRVEPKAQPQPQRAEPKAPQPQRVEPKAQPQPQRADPKAQPQPPRADPKAPQPQRVEPKAQPQPRAEPQQRAEPKAPPQPQRAEPKAPQPPRAEPKAPPQQPQRAPAQPQAPGHDQKREH